LRGRRGWSDETKARLVAETLAPGANVSAIARWAGMAPSQLFGWRRQALASGAVASAAKGERPLSFMRFEPARSGLVEIVIGDLVVRAGPYVTSDHLAAVPRSGTLPYPPPNAAGLLLLRHAGLESDRR